VLDRAYGRERRIREAAGSIRWVVSVLAALIRQQRKKRIQTTGKKDS
jgi:hypothetical protein